MADMGFLPQVEWILRQAERQHQTLLFSATLDGVVDTLIKRYQHDPVMHEIESSSVTVEEMEHRFLQVHQMDKAKVAAAIARNVNRTMIFVRTKRGADRLAEQLEREGVSALAIHGDLRQTAREKALADFSAGKLTVLVATDVAARGIHVDDVDIVDPLRPARGPQGLPAPLGAHGPRRRVRHGGHPGAVGPGARGQAADEAHRRHPAHRRGVLQRSPAGRSGRLGPGRRRRGRLSGRLTRQVACCRALSDLR